MYYRTSDFYLRLSFQRMTCIIDRTYIVCFLEYVNLSGVVSEQDLALLDHTLL